MIPYLLFWRHSLYSRFVTLQPNQTSVQLKTQTHQIRTYPPQGFASYDSLCLEVLATYRLLPGWFVLLGFLFNSHFLIETFPDLPFKLYHIASITLLVAVTHSLKLSYMCFLYPWSFPTRTSVPWDQKDPPLVGTVSPVPVNVWYVVEAQ